MLKDAIKRYKNRRDARLGIQVSQHYDSVEEYRMRRAERLRKNRMDAEDEGEWRTTDNGHKILIKDGVVVGGNPFAIATMGKPEGKEFLKSVKPSENREIGSFLRDTKNRDSIAEALKGHKEDCIFGGYYRVTEEKGESRFFNPYTGDWFDVRTAFDQAGPWGMEYDSRADDLGAVINKIGVNEKAQKLYNRSMGIIQKGDTVKVVGGRTLEHGTEAKVRAVYDTKYGKYVYLDNGEKIQAKHLSIVDEEGSTIRSSEGKGSDDVKAAHEKYKKESEERDRAKKAETVTQADVERTIGSAKTRAKIVDALKKAGYKVQDNTDDSSSTVDVRVMRPDGTYVRVYKSGKELKYQNWQKAGEEKLKSDTDIRDSKYFVQKFLDNHKNESKLNFNDLSDNDKYWYIMADNANYFLKQGVDGRKAWSRAIDTADMWDKRGFKGYGEGATEEKELTRKVLESIIEGLKR